VQRIATQHLKFNVSESLTAHSLHRKMAKRVAPTVVRSWRCHWADLPANDCRCAKHRRKTPISGR